MPEVAAPIARLINELAKLPGIGLKTAQRLAFHMLKAPAPEAEALAMAIREVRDKLTTCKECCNITDTDLCRFCSDPGRDRTTVCVVENPTNVLSIERTREYRGLYHVLHGSISPLAGRGPESLTLEVLTARVRAGGVREVIVATNPNVEGETTATYLAQILRPLGVRVTRPAMGLPMGADLEYTDEVTMAKALDGRHEV
ncbi:MAG: recombination mediator RecR [Acidobacteriota bacterium]